MFAESAERGPKVVSVFSKNRGQQVDQSNVEAERLRKAEELYSRLNVFKSMKVDAKQISPINNVILEKKERQKQRAMTAGKAWGSMPKVELTEELKNDLRAIKFRNQIFPKRFYKSNDTDKLP